jgi:hypothetical protein
MELGELYLACFSMGTEKGRGTHGPLGLTLLGKRVQRRALTVLPTPWPPHAEMLTVLEDLWPRDLPREDRTIGLLATFFHECVP